MNAPIIRPAEPADTPTIVRFNIALAEESEGLRLDPVTAEAGVRRMFSDPALGRYFLAVSPEGQRLGQLMITTEWSETTAGPLPPTRRWGSPAAATM